MESLELIAELGILLKNTPRKGWVLRGLSDPESVAEHIFCLALMAMIEARERGLDAFRAAALALIHDLPESVMGDLTPEEKKRMGRAEYRELEERSIRNLSHGLPRASAELILSLFEEYRGARSPEAELVEQLDKLEMAIQAVKYASRGLPAAEAREFVDSARREIRDEKLREVAERLYAKLEGRGQMA